jgi:hypothetical protein
MFKATHLVIGTWIPKSISCAAKEYWKAEKNWKTIHQNTLSQN